MGSIPSMNHDRQQEQRFPSEVASSSMGSSRDPPRAPPVEIARALILSGGLARYIAEALTAVGASCHVVTSFPSLPSCLGDDYDRSHLPPEFGPPVWENLLTPPVRVVRALSDF